MNKDFSIQKTIDKDYLTDERKARKKETNEIFTPYPIVKDMCDKIPDSDWADPTKTFLEPSFGNGAFVLYILWNRIQHGVSPMQALKTLYGTELMQDNAEETRSRVLELFDAMGVEYDRDEAMSVLEENLVCTDFFEWDFERWCKKGGECEALF